MSAVNSVADVRAIAVELGMRELSYVSNLAGRWHMPGVELVAHQQWPSLVVAVYATGRGSVDGWDVRVTAGFPSDALEGLVQRAHLVVAA